MLSFRNGAISAAVAAAIASTTMSVTPANASPRGDAAMLAAVAGVFGTIATIAAANAARDRYYDGPVYYGGQAYAAPPAYVVPGYGYHRQGYRPGLGGWRRHHHWHR
jgi:hypothetical protein